MVDRRLLPWLQSDQKKTHRGCRSRAGATDHYHLDCLIDRIRPPASCFCSLPLLSVTSAPCMLVFMSCLGLSSSFISLATLPHLITFSLSTTCCTQSFALFRPCSHPLPSLSLVHLLLLFPVWLFVSLVPASFFSLRKRIPRPHHLRRSHHKSHATHLVLTILTIHNLRDDSNPRLDIGDTTPSTAISHTRSPYDTVTRTHSRDSRREVQGKVTGQTSLQASQTSSHGARETAKRLRKATEPVRL